ncbi:MAG: hypothetical protein JXJ20_01760 [Anaerolineae bacterium]|nr:hypothetical protein [Anaerolineae bacterium]
MKQIETLRWKPHWISHMGCVLGCLEHLGIDVSNAWLFGATGHAFLLNIHDELCPSGPTAWKTPMLSQLGRNIGYEEEVIFGMGPEGNIPAKQQEAWDKVRAALDAGIPCYGWGLAVPEFYVIYGYDETGYYYSGPMHDAGHGPKPWQKLGDSWNGMIEVYIVRRGEPVPDAQAVKAALTFALEFAQGPSKWVLPNYNAGLTAYDRWIGAIERQKQCDEHGLSYNAAAWDECRRCAVHFLEEAKTRVGNGTDALFDAAIGPYRTVAENLTKVTEVFPFVERKPEHLQDESRCSTAINALRAARSAEEQGLAALKALCAAL